MNGAHIDRSSCRIDPLAEARRLNEPENLGTVQTAMLASGIDATTSSSALNAIILALAQQRVQRASDYERENLVLGLAGDDRRIGPDEVMKAIEKIKKGLEAVSEGFDLLADARKLTPSNEVRRIESLRTVHHVLMRQVAHDILCRVRDGSILEESLDSQLPEYAAYIPDLWAGLFSSAASTASRVLDVYSAKDFRGPTNAQPQWLVTFIHALADIYQEATGRVPAAPRPSGNVESDWRGPFSRLVEGLWPLTGAEDLAPSSGKIERALEVRSNALAPAKGE